MVTILTGDALETLATLPDRSARCCVTSPPYFGLRDYGVAGQIGMEASPDAFVSRLVDVFREVRRVLTDDGTLWLNLGDSYAGSANSGGPNANSGGPLYRANTLPVKRAEGLKPKDLIGIPWRVAFALQSDGWYLRSDIIWHKPNPMPESVTDRPTKSHEYVFLLSKSERYYYDAKAIAERAVKRVGFEGSAKGYAPNDRNDGGRSDYGSHEPGDRNARTVWSITTKPFKGSHFATMPPDLARKCVAAGSAVGDTVLDPFGGAGTTGLVAHQSGRNAVLIELNPAYADMARKRLHDDAPLFAAS